MVKVKSSSSKTIIHWGITIGFSVFLTFLLASYFAFIFGFLFGFFLGTVGLTTLGTVGLTTFINNNSFLFLGIVYLFSFVVIFFIFDYILFKTKICFNNQKLSSYLFDSAIFLGVFSIILLITGPQGFGESVVIGAIVGGIIGPMISKAKKY